MKFIKIYTKSQLVLLRNINYLLGQYRLPREILKRMDYILENGSIGKQGSVYVLLEPVRDDLREIEDVLNMYPLKIEFMEDIIQVDIQNTNNQLAKGREWYFNQVYVHKTDIRIYVIYSILQKHLYKEIEGSNYVLYRG